MLEGLALRERKGVDSPALRDRAGASRNAGFADTPAPGEPAVRELREQGRERWPSDAAKQAGAARRACTDAIETSVVPAYRKLIGFFEGQLAAPTTDDGVWKLPDGDAYYAYRLRHETTTR